MRRRGIFWGSSNAGMNGFRPKQRVGWMPGQVHSDEFGWLMADQLPRYQDGKRYYRGSWISAAEEARLRSNIHNGWNVESEHYAVVTNDSLEEGVKLTKALELLNDVWRQVFVGYYAKPAQVEQWFAAAETARVELKNSTAKDKSDDGAAAGGEMSVTGPTVVATTAAIQVARKLHQVVYFREKQQYVDVLKAAQPQIDMSIGFYSDNARTAYFYASDSGYGGTLYHEGTHQLFRETPPATVDPGRKNNFWIVEAIACYMEIARGASTVGRRGVRIVRYRRW